MPDATIIPFELPLPQVLPTIEGNVDYRQLRDQLGEHLDTAPILEGRNWFLIRGKQPLTVRKDQ
jgi:hypothetical protein